MLRLITSQTTIKNMRERMIEALEKTGFKVEKKNGVYTARRGRDLILALGLTKEGDSVSCLIDSSNPDIHELKQELDKLIPGGVTLKKYEGKKGEKKKAKALKKIDEERLETTTNIGKAIAILILIIPFLFLLLR